MALTRKQNTVTFPASGDLSSNQFRIMAIDDNGRVMAAVDGATAYIGVLMNKPAAIDREAEVAIISSIVKMEAGAAVAERDAITAVAGGRGSPTTTEDDEVIGYANTPASASAVLFEVVVTAPAQFRT